MLLLYDFPVEYADGLQKIYRETLKYFHQRDIFEVEASNVSRDEIREVNAHARNKDAVTDVLSFPNLDGIIFPVKKRDYKTDVDPETGRVVLGEILVCFDKVREQAIEYGHSEERECFYLFLHGLLHLFGFDHENENDKAA
ncbi:MAG: rRNA maturation RNase YbeY, partial [Clostridiales bacterium]|nr:rRNA maturation RNase YbeY [Clostridiales bacterium]